MKFYCDRCKTRYTIADERVRGKVLKIRCKNCANVITVREGTGADGGAEPEPAGAGKPSDGVAALERRTASNTGRLVPSISRTATATSPAPLAEIYGDGADAAASDQLEDEWYVSLDGDQAGPYTLGQAQAWVAARKATDDLHCWTEGFDDWLPVEKVSHFRGLRTRSIKRPPTQPPPIPADAGRREDSRPLFASTMAALEADGAAAEADALRHPPKLSKRAPTPPPVAPPRSAAKAKPSVAEQVATVPAEPAPKPRSRTVSQSVALFDTGADPDDDDDDDDDADNDDAATNKPRGVERSSEPDLDSLRPGRRMADAAPEPAAASDDDDLSIGEVSRVVRIADLAKSAMGPRAPTGAAAPVVTRRTPAAGIPRVSAEGGTGSQPVVIRTGQTGMVPKFGPAGVAYVGAQPAMTAEQLELSVSPPPKRNHGVYWLAGALLLVLVAAIVFVIATQRSGNDDEPATVAGAEYDELGRRIDDPLRRAAAGSGSAVSAGSGSAKVVRNPSGGSGKSGGGSGTTASSGSDAGSATVSGTSPLTPDDVIDKSRQMSTGTQRCWEQAQKRDLFIEAKSIKVTLSVDSAGKVQQVSLSDFANDFLGQCLSTAIKRWTFRPSTNGIVTQIKLAFTK